jgi:hypothetical protein
VLVHRDGWSLFATTNARRGDHPDVRIEQGRQVIEG